MVELIVVLAVSVSMLLGGLAVSLMSRRPLRRTRGSFRCKLRVQSGLVDRLGRRRARRWFRGGWVHDVLIVQRGWLVVSHHHLPVRSAEAVRPEKNTPP